MQLLLNLAASDLLASFGNVFTSASSYYGNWRFPDTICQVYAFLSFTTFLVSGSFYSTVIDKCFYTELKQIICIGITPHSGIRAVPKLSSVATQVAICIHRYMVVFKHDITYAIFCYVLPIMLVATLYTIVLRHVVRYYPNIIHMQGVVTRTEGTFISRNCLGLKPMEVHLLKMNIVMVCVLIFVWTPYTVISILSVLNPDLPPIMYLFLTMFAKSRCVWNPLIYFLMNAQLRREMLSMTCRASCRYQESTTPIALPDSRNRALQMFNLTNIPQRNVAYKATSL
ncbi:unnamed protein product [Darwinula stevensoni]|uniref:G-protein coupled receptors family 1 profile domain-containing protein n=1 Tax=Darwinula stevensoni TaxID=69355 RepID=A0A7R8XBL3_9CRUS|nr:unnamed protein product [Darwinula stevensoni]CAG0884931.1 unnamed protein product [Darwinula stevensoni]